MGLKKSENFISELCFLMIFNVVFGALFWSLDSKGCYTLVGRFYVISGILYSIWLCILSITQVGCERFKICVCYLIEIVNVSMTVLFFINLIYMANKNHFCSETSFKILSYIFLGIVSVLFVVIFFMILRFLIKKFLRSRFSVYNPVHQQV